MGDKDIQEGDETDGEKDDTAEISEASVSEDAAAAVALPVAAWVGIVEIIIGLGVIWREIGAPGFGVW